MPQPRRCITPGCDNPETEWFAGDGTFKTLPNCRDHIHPGMKSAIEKVEKQYYANARKL